MHRILIRGSLAVLASTIPLFSASAQEVELRDPPPAMRFSTTQTEWARAIVEALGLDQEIATLKELEAKDAEIEEWKHAGRLLGGGD